MLRVHGDLAVEMGVQPQNVCIPDNSSVVEIIAVEKIAKHAIKAPSELRVVEGQTVSELSDVLMRDRKALGQEGFCVVVATVDRRTGKLHKSPDIISRGFVYLRDNKELMDQTRLIIRKSVETSMRNPRAADLDVARDDLAEALSRFLLQRTMKRPIVIPVIVVSGSPTSRLNEFPRKMTVNRCRKSPPKSAGFQSSLPVGTSNIRVPRHLDLRLDFSAVIHPRIPDA